MDQNLYQLILASQSPRRKELLTHLGVSFAIEPANIDEEIEFDNAAHLVETLAYQKAKEVLSHHKSNVIVIGSDTTVALGDKIYNKPKNLEEAVGFLESLSDKVHEVVTGVAIISKEVQKVFHVKTKVKFKKLSMLDIENYLKFNEYQDKAGAYGIQGAAGVFVESLEGSYSSVVGLPQAEILEAFEEWLGEEWRNKFV